MKTKDEILREMNRLLTIAENVGEDKPMKQKIFNKVEALQWVLQEPK